ncbi:MAG TPA: hypothetical protein PLN85_01235 [archaeon]|nr:hypothetical protein [archaeon]
MKINKKNVGIDIDEILRAKWLQFDKYYVEEFGLDGVPKEQEYVYDFFNNYKFNDVEEIIKELKEPEDIPENISPLEYQLNDKNEAPADFLLFKKENKIKLTSKEVYNRFMYEDYLFEIHGSAPMMYRNMDVDVNKFYDKYCDTVNFTLFSVENRFSIPPTLFFLSKIKSRFENIRFVKKSIEMWNNIDILITTDPEILKLGTPWFKKLIKVKRPYNEKFNSYSMEILQIAELIENKDFEKIIKYKKNENG